MVEAFRLDPRPKLWPMPVMAPVFRSSGDLIADRRYDYAAAALAEGDAAAAADLFAQACDIAPRWAAAWFGLGEALELAGEAERAAAAYQRAGACDGGDELGATLRHARLAGLSPPAPPASYIRALFDQYAPRFDRHLREDLGYRGPEILVSALREVCAAHGRTFHFDRVLDLGCGTGLFGRALYPHVDSLHGVDLSPKMVEAARATGCYSQVDAADLLAFLQGEGEGSADLVVAADVLVYLGDLAGVFRESARVCEAGGLFAFTVQAMDGADYALGDDLRYAHSSDYIRRLARDSGFEVARLERVSTRREAHRDAPGLAVVLARP